MVFYVVYTLVRKSALSLPILCDMKLTHCHLLRAEVPSNLIFKKLGSMWLAALVVAFGIVSIASAFMQDIGGFMATRVRSLYYVISVVRR